MIPTEPAFDDNADADHTELLSCASLSRAPSFSGWCDTNQPLQTDHRTRGGNDDDGEDFELTFQSRNLQAIGMDKRGDLERDCDGANGRNGVNESYVPFDVEEDSGMSIEGSSSELSPANVLKTLFFICVWYTFSLFLTL